MTPRLGASCDLLPGPSISISSLSIVVPEARATVQVVVRSRSGAHRCRRRALAARRQPGAAGLGATRKVQTVNLADDGIAAAPPSCAAIWLALKPSDQSRLSFSTRSSVNSCRYLSAARDM